MSNYKRIERYPGYEINPQGSIRHSETKRILKPSPSFNGHLRVKLQNKTEYVSRLIAETFIPKEDERLTDVRHKDGDKENLSLGNLEWVTHRDTQYDSFGYGRNAPGGCLPPRPIYDLYTDTKYESVKACSRATGLQPVTIRRMIESGKRFKEI